jgi:hypothetical protein
VFQAGEETTKTAKRNAHETAGLTREREDGFPIYARKWLSFVRLGGRKWVRSEILGLRAAGDSRTHRRGAENVESTRA